MRSSLGSVSFLSCALSCASLAACGGASSSTTPTSAGGVECPTGQAWDGEYCRTSGSGDGSEHTAPAAGGSGGAPTESEVAAAGGATGGAAAAVVAPELGTGGATGGSGSLPEVAAAEATPIDVTMAAQAGPLVTYLASAHLPAGAKPFGAPFAAQFAEGQRLSLVVQLEAGRCYTVVAAGLPPIRELDVELRADGSEPPAPPLAKDAGSGPQAILGSRDQCYRAPGGPVKLVMTVTKGEGVAAAQLFAR